VLALASIWGLARSQDSATFNNVAFALLHICVLTTGCWPALVRPAAVPTTAGPSGAAVAIGAS
jgi:hypothetical protein